MAAMVAAGLVLPVGSAQAAPPSIASTCTVNLVAGTHNCVATPGITVQSLTGGRLLLRLTFAPGQTASFAVTYGSAPSAFSVNIGDSVSNDGGGGDSGTQSNDAEAMVFGQQLSVFGRDGTPTQPLASVNTAIGAGTVLGFEVANGSFCWNHQSYACVNSSWLYALAGQADFEGPVNYDVYAAFNRVVSGRTDRNGTGVASVSVFLN